MSQLARFEITRQPDVALSVRAATRGFNLLTVAQDSQHLTGSPAALLLSPAQVSAIKPLATIKPAKIAKTAGVYDGLHDALTTAFDAGNFQQIDKLATAFLKQHPIIPLARRSPTEQAIRRFFIFKGNTSTTAERLALHNGINETDRAIWLRAAHSRIDIEKGQILATAVSGVASPRDVDLLGGLRADLAFAVLAACIETVGPRCNPRDIPIKYVDGILALNPFLPELAFAMEPCKTRDPDQTATPLSRRLSRIAAYDQRMKAVLAQASAVQAGDGRGNGAVAGDGRGDGAAGTPGHTDACDCKCDDAPCMPIDPCCAEINWYVAELLTLKDKTHCYKPSDIAYIENVAPYETRVRTHGFTRTVTETSEDETNFSRTEERDHQFTDRFNLQKEISNNQKASLNVDAKISGEIYSQKYEVKTSAGLSKESAYREAREEAREAVEKATLKIQVQTRKLRTRSVTMENTEQNKHKFKNTTAIAAVAKYFWVTQEKRGQLFGHGQAITVDLLIPSPAMLFTAMERMKRAKGEPAGPPVAPQKPFFTITAVPKKVTRDLTANDFTPENYHTLAADNGISVYPDPPADLSPQTTSVQGTSKNGTPDVTIPAGFTATKVELTSADVKPNSKVCWISLKFGGGEVKAWGKGTWAPKIAFISERNSGPTTVSNGFGTFQNSSIGVEITLVPDPVDKGPWKKEIFSLIMAKYEADLEKYEEKLADYQSALAAYNEKMDDKIKGRHPFACEEIIRAEVKRSSIFMMCGEFDWPGVMNMNAEPCGLPWPNRQKAADATREWYFFDRAFDWNRASFIFYDYFRNPICQWVDGFEPDEPNFLMKAFLRAGYCRATVPVSPGMEQDVILYLETGRIWGPNETLPSNPLDPRWISVADEIKHSYGCYQQDREGHAEAYPDPVDGSFDSRVKIVTDRYWSVIPPGPDQDAINLDLNRQIFIDGVEYRIISISEDPDSPVYTAATTSTMSWIFGLDRKLEFAPFVDASATKPVLKPYNYAIGAQYVGAPFHFELPTDLIWIGDQGSACLPCYPIDCGCEVVPDTKPEGK